MNVIVTGRMGNGTIQAKLEALNKVERISTIYFLRKYPGPAIKKVKYIILPRICRFAVFNVMLTPLLLSYYALKLNVSFIISYHIIPHAYFAAISSLITNKPYIVCQTGSLIQNKACKKWVWFFLKKVLFDAQKICVPGKISAQFWIEKGIPATLIENLHSTVDTDKYLSIPFDEREYDFIYSGRITVEKRVDYLLHAFSVVTAEIPDAKLLIVGDGEMKKTCESLTHKLKLSQNVQFVGHQNEILPWLYKSRFIVLTSETEGLPCAILEGMSTGLIPVTTSVGNLTDVVIHGETGYLVDKDNLDGYAKTMISLMNSSDEKNNELRLNARKIIQENHSHESSLSKWNNILLNGTEDTARGN